MIAGRIKHTFRGVPVELEWESEGATLEERQLNAEWGAMITLASGDRHDVLGWMSGPEQDKASDLVDADIAKHWREGGRG